MAKLAQADREAIRRVFETAMTDIPEGEFADWLAHWTTDARLMPPDMNDVVGHEALKAWMRDWPKIRRFEIVDEDIEGDGDLAVLICHFVRVLDGPDGGEVRQTSRQVLKFRRQPDQRWLIAAAIFNTVGAAP